MSMLYGTGTLSVVEEEVDRTIPFVVWNKYRPLILLWNNLGVAPKLPAVLQILIILSPAASQGRLSGNRTTQTQRNAK